MGMLLFIFNLNIVSQRSYNITKKEDQIEKVIKWAQCQELAKPQIKLKKRATIATKVTQISL